MGPLSASIPPRVMQVMRACLQKNPKQRLDSAQAVRLALDGAFEDASDDAESRRLDMAAVHEQLQQRTEAAVAVVRRTLGRRAALVGAAALMTGVVAGAAVWSTTRPAPPAPPETRTEISTPATGDPASFALSPDGRQILFVASGDGASRLWLRSLATTSAQPLTGTDGATWPFWSSDGRSVGFFAGGALKRLDLGSGASVSAPGLVAYRTVTSNQRQLIWVDPSGAARGTVGDPDGSLQHPKVSPDGRRVVVARTAQGNQDLWLLDGARSSRMTFDPARDPQPVWSPDGTRVVFTSFRTRAGQLYQVRTNGVGGEERLVASDRNMPPTSWSRDGRFLLSFSVAPQTDSDLWVVPMLGDHTPSLFLQTPFREAYGAFSPDGGIMPVWRPDGKALYYLNPAGAMVAAPITVVRDALEPGAPVVLFPTRIYGGGEDTGQGRQYDVAPDGRFLINTELPGDAAPITLIQNWQPGK